MDSREGGFDEVFNVEEGHSRDVSKFCCCAPQSTGKARRIRSSSTSPFSSPATHASTMSGASCAKRAMRLACPRSRPSATAMSVSVLNRPSSSNLCQWCASPSARIRGVSCPALRTCRSTAASTRNSCGASSGVMTCFLLPGFAKDLKYGLRTYNARSETVAELASFNHAWAKARHSPRVCRACSR